MDLTQIGTGLAVVGVGTSLAVVLPMKPKTKKIVGGIGVVVTIFGLGILGYGFISGAGLNDLQASQTMTDSPGGVQIQGDNNTVNQGPQDRRIKKENEFIQEMRAAGPVAVRLNTVDGREPEFLQGQLYKLLIDSEWAVEAGGVSEGAVHWVNVTVAVRDKSNVPPAAIALVNQLRSNGIESFLDLEENPAAFVLERNPVTEKADFIVRVGDQPPSNNK